MTILSTNPWECESKTALVSLPPPYTHKLHISTSGPPRRSPREPVIVMITGGAAPCALYIRLQRLLSRKFRVYFYDRAGYDLSEVAPREGNVVGEVTGRKGEEIGEAKAKKGEQEGIREVAERRMLRFETVGKKRREGGVKKDEDVVAPREGNWKGIVMATDTAQELKALLSVIDVRGPYVLVAHSYGGIVAREFMALMNDGSTSSSPSSLHHEEEGINKVIGLALMDTGSEMLYHTYQPNVPPPAFDTMLEGVDIGKISRLREECGLSDAEWNNAISAIERSIPGADLEDNRGSARILSFKKQIEKHALDPWPVAVLKADSLRDWKPLFEAGVERGNGTEEERRECRWFLEELDVFDYEVKIGQVGLTGSGEEKVRWRDVRDCGHDVVIRRPEVVVEEVEWVMGELEKRGWK